MSLTESDWQEAARLLDCEVAAIKAVAKVESPGALFMGEREPFILFEAHIFSRLTGHKYDATHPHISSRKWNKKLYRSSKGEHLRLQEAVALDRDAALQSASWGRFQILGKNWKRCGFTSLQSFINAMYRDEKSHLMAFCQFILSMGLADELQRKDWDGFASVYNGPLYAEHRYDDRIQDAYEELAA